MRFGEKIWRLYLGKFGLTGDEYQGIGLDMALAIPMTLAVLVLVVYPSESHPSDRLKYAAIVSLVVLIAGLLLAKRKAIVVGSIAAIVGFRGLIAIAQGLWQGLIIVGIAALVFILCTRSSPAD
ncbi:MAG: hypothetical protein DMG48_01495 [Acidobacteria bacterium]|nr:MAG: hypothetical protein DMG48_01495 [Acidobacteriota bacterium]